MHEAGHAVVGQLVGMQVDHVDIDRAYTRVRALVAPTAVMLESEMAMTLAGRAAEEILLGAVSVGAKIDLSQVTRTAMSYHAEYGMGSAVGLLSLDVDKLDLYGPLYKAVSELVDRCHGRALGLVRRHRDSVERVAAALVRDRYLDAREVAALVRSSLQSLVRVPDCGPEPVPRWAPSPARRGTG